MGFLLHSEVELHANLHICSAHPTPLQQTNVLAGGAIKKPLQEENSWLTGEGTRATSTSVTGRQVSFAAGPS